MKKIWNLIYKLYQKYLVDYLIIKDKLNMDIMMIRILNCHINISLEQDRSTTVIYYIKIIQLQSII